MCTEFITQSNYHELFMLNCLQLYILFIRIEYYVRTNIRNKQWNEILLNSDRRPCDLAVLKKKTKMKINRTDNIITKFVLLYYFWCGDSE